MPSAIASMRACVSVSRSMKAALAPPARASATSSALAARIAAASARMARSIASQRLVLLLGGRERQHPRGGARAGGKLGHQVGQIGVAVDGFQRRGHVGSNLG